MPSFLSAASLIFSVSFSMVFGFSPVRCLFFWFDFLLGQFSDQVANVFLVIGKKDLPNLSLIDENISAAWRKPCTFWQGIQTLVQGNIGVVCLAQAKLLGLRVCEKRYQYERQSQSFFHFICFSSRQVEVIRDLLSCSLLPELSKFPSLVFWLHDYPCGCCLLTFGWLSFCSHRVVRDILLVGVLRRDSFGWCGDLAGHQNAPAQSTAWVS